MPGQDLHEAAAASALSALLDDALDDEEREVVSMRYGLAGHESMRLVEISRALAYSPGRARSIHTRALRKLRLKASENPERYDEEFKTLSDVLR